jgi:hypothetical protein
LLLPWKDHSWLGPTQFLDKEYVTQSSRFGFFHLINMITADCSLNRIFYFFTNPFFKFLIILTTCPAFFSNIVDHVVFTQFLAYSRIIYHYIGYWYRWVIHIQLMKIQPSHVPSGLTPRKHLTVRAWSQL